MKTLVNTLLIAGLMLNLTGCAAIAFNGVNQGIIFTNSARNEMVTENTVGSKKGEACATSILGWVTTGDASVAAAARAGGITRIASVDNNYTNVISLYAKYCVVVTGE